MLKTHISSHGNFPKLGGTILVVPLTRTTVVWGLFWGLYYGTFGYPYIRDTFKGGYRGYIGII